MGVRPSKSFEEAQLKQLQMLEKLSGKMGLIDGLYAIFCAQIPERLEKIRALVAHGDLESVEFEAHALKSASGNLGAVELSWWAGEMEDMASRGENLDHLMAEMDAVWERGLRDVRSWVESRGV